MTTVRSLRLIRWTMLGLIVLIASGIALVKLAPTVGWQRATLSGGDNSFLETVAFPESVPIGGPFTLVNAAGHTVTDRDFRGKYMLIYFGYTFCPDVCPTTLTTLAGALEKLGANADRVQPLFITVDPKRDTPQVIGRYTAAFSPRLIGLTGTSGQIAAVEKEYRVYAAEQRTGPGPNDYGMDHSSIIYLMGPDGHFIAPIRANADTAVMAGEIAKSMR